MNAPHRVARRFADAPLVSILIAVVALMALAYPGRFLAPGNLESLAYQLPMLALLSFGMMISMLTGGINLAVVSSANLTGIVTALALKALTGGDSASASLLVVLVAMTAGLICAIASGALMGFLIAYLEVPAILATLGVMTLIDGTNVVLTHGYTLSDFPEALLAIGNSDVFGLPAPFILLIAAIAALAVLIRSTRFGFDLYMIGSNLTAAQYSNINVRSVLMRQYVLSACFSALTGFIMMGQFNSVKSNYAQSYVLVSILACFLGGVDPFGGSGRLTGMALSVVILQVVSSGVNLLRVDPFFVTTMWGAMILAVIAINHLVGQRARWRSVAPIMTNDKEIRLAAGEADKGKSEEQR
jgi:simple sugar transport system permease protein